MKITGGYNNSIKVYSPNSKNANLIISRYNYTDDSTSGSFQQTYCKTVSISGENITTINYGMSESHYGNIVSVYHVNEIWITKVVGYRK